MDLRSDRKCCLKSSEVLETQEYAQALQETKRSPVKEKVYVHYDVVRTLASM